MCYSVRTARELVSSGKKHWLTRRAKEIQAKGLGRLQTFWVNSTPHLQESNSRHESAKDLTLALIEEELPSSPTQYSNTTVMVADVDFVSDRTYSQRKRNPEQIFRLYEAFNRTMDEVVDEMNGVVKIEAVGNRYMAAAGVLVGPSARPNNHNCAQVMSLFAWECMTKMQQAQAEIFRIDKENPCGISVRIGLHTGDVVGGELNSSFHLFGDTVNTATRMHSSCRAGRIHCSQATASELIACGKAHWLTTAIRRRASSAANEGSEKLVPEEQDISNSTSSPRVKTFYVDPTRSMKNNQDGDGSNSQPGDDVDLSNSGFEESIGSF